MQEIPNNCAFRCTALLGAAAAKICPTTAGCSTATGICCPLLSPTVPETTCSQGDSAGKRLITKSQQDLIPGKSPFATPKPQRASRPRRALPRRRGRSHLRTTPPRPSHRRTCPPLALLRPVKTLRVTPGGTFAPGHAAIAPSLPPQCFAEHKPPPPGLTAKEITTRGANRDRDPPSACIRRISLSFFVCRRLAGDAG